MLRLSRNSTPIFAKQPPNSGVNTAMPLIRRPLVCVLLLIGCFFLVGTAVAAPPTFQTAFSSTTIAPGNISTLTYTLDNSAETSGVTDLTFSNSLPSGLVIAAPSRATTTCGGVGTFSASPGSGSLSFAGYRLSGGSSCTFRLDVTATSPGSFANTTSSLSTSAGNSSSANATLTVDASRPGLSMSFSNGTIAPGAVTTLTYTINNTLNGSAANFLQFRNTLPDGLLFDDFLDWSSSCGSSFGNGSGAAIPPAVSNGNQASFSSFSVGAGASCTHLVTVTGIESGDFINESGDLTGSTGPSGHSTAKLSVISGFLNAQFPTYNAPGESAILTFTINNEDRFNAATDISFSTDLNSTLSGLAATAIPSAGFCGAGSTISGTSNLTVSGASVAPEGSCTFTVTVLIPANAASGSYTNTTSTVFLTVGSPTTRPAVSNALRVSQGPLLSMEFLDPSVAAGENATLRFTLTNTSNFEALQNVSFTVPIQDESHSEAFINALPPPNSCGSGSSFTNIGSPGSALSFQISGASLFAGASCTFDLVLSVASDAQPRSLTFLSSSLTAEYSGEDIPGKPAQADLDVFAGPRLTLDLIDEWATPDSAVTAIFTLRYRSEAPSDVSGIGFTVNLDSALTGMVASGLPLNNVCGPGSSVTGSGVLTFSGGSLAIGGQCSFSVSLLIPAGTPPGQFSISSSSISSTTAGQAVSGPITSKQVRVSGLSLSKAFLEPYVETGGSATVRYTITNAASSPAATSITFSDNYNFDVPGLTIETLPTSPCGVSSGALGTTSFSLSDGELLPGASCTFEVVLLVPLGVSAGSYVSSTSDISATVNFNNTVSPNAVDILYVNVLEQPPPPASVPVGGGGVSLLLFSLLLGFGYRSLRLEA